MPALPNTRDPLRGLTSKTEQTSQPPAQPSAKPWHGSSTTEAGNRDPSGAHADALGVPPGGGPA